MLMCEVDTDATAPVADIETDVPAPDRLPATMPALLPPLLTLAPLVAVWSLAALKVMGANDPDWLIVEVERRAPAPVAENETLVPAPDNVPTSSLDAVLLIVPSALWVAVWLSPTGTLDPPKGPMPGAAKEPVSLIALMVLALTLAMAPWALLLIALPACARS